jgi:hypothetical protein
MAFEWLNWFNTWWQHLIAGKRTAWALLILAVVSIGILITLAIKGFITIDYSNHNLSLSVGKDWLRPGGRMEKIIPTAAGKDYVLQNVTQIVDIERLGSEAIAKERIVYSVMALKDISNTATSFTESYGASDGEKIYAWRGSEDEGLNGLQDETRLNETSLDYLVHYILQKGDVLPVVTGSTTKFSLNRILKKSIFPNGRLFRPHENFWDYECGDDVIGIVTMIIESNTIKLDLPNDVPSVRWWNIDKTTYQDFSSKPDIFIAKELGVRRIITRWTDIKPGDNLRTIFLEQ